jgi:exonuclease SbcD
MKICCFADLHAGVKTYGKLDPITGLNTREIEAFNILDQVIDYCISNKIFVLVGAGDMYKNNSPSPTLQDEFNKRIKRASDAGIQVLLLDGNHDVSKLETSVSATKSFNTLEVSNVVHTRFHMEYGVVDDTTGKTYQFVFLPTYHTKQQIESIVNKINYDYPTIFIGHLTMRGAMLNDWLITEKEVYIETDVFNNQM